MAQGFSSTDAAFAGLRLTRERPGLVLALSGVTFASSVISGLALSILAPGAAERFAELERSADSITQGQMIAAMSEAAPAMLVNVPLLLLVFGVVLAALYRALITPLAGGRGVAFGRAELLQAALLVLAYLLFVVAAMVVTIAVGVVGGLLGAVLGGGAAGLLGALAFIALPVALIYLGVRLSLAGGQTFVEGRLRLFGSWRLTEKRVGVLLGAYLLALALAFVVSLLILVIFAALASVLVLATGGAISDLGPMFQARTTSPGEYLRPLTLLGSAVSAVVQVLFVAIAIGPAAEAFRTFGDPGGALRTADPVKRTYDATV